MKTTLLGLLVAVMMVGAERPVQASSILYTETVIANGSFNDTTYTGALVTLSGVGDTSAVSVDQFGALWVTVPATVTVAGIAGTGTFFDTIKVFNNPGVGIAGFNDFTAGPDMVDIGSPVFASYDLKSAIGPVSGSTLFQTGAIYATSNGDFTMDFGTATGITFTATPVPETSTVLLTALCGFAIAVALLRPKAPRPPGSAGITGKNDQEQRDVEWPQHHRHQRADP